MFKKSNDRPGKPTDLQSESRSGDPTIDIEQESSSSRVVRTQNSHFYTFISFRDVIIRPYARTIIYVASLLCVAKGREVTLTYLMSATKFGKITIRTNMMTEYNIRLTMIISKVLKLKV